MRRNDTNTKNANPSKNIASVKRTRDSYSHRIADFMRNKRREEGDRRNSLWAGLTMEEKLEQLASRPGESRKQVFKLTGTNMSAQEALRLIRIEVQNVN